ncbi:MAG: ABC transporter substrate-binding protein [Pseudomonadota bacterium]
MKTIILTIFAFFFFAAPTSVHAALSSSKAQDFVESMGAEAISFLKNSNLSSSAKQEKFRALLNRNFDLKTIGRFAMGRHWRTATPEQQKKYLRLFENMVVDIYASRFQEYEGQNFEVKSVREAGKNDFIVTSHIIPQGGQTVQVDWRVRDRNGSPKIIDVIIEGVSMSLTQRSDFASVIQRGGGNVAVLISHLEK